jgi:chemotaxis family two-component system response regulator Rcp1
LQQPHHIASGSLVQALHAAIVQAMSIHRILHVEDNYGDANLLREAFSELGTCIEIDIVANGVAAIERLQKQDHDTTVLPELILSDINMPRMDGFALLHQLKQNLTWSAIPVLMLTSSSRSNDRERALLLGAVGYVVKPPAYEGYLVLAQRLIRFPDLGLAPEPLPAA